MQSEKERVATGEAIVVHLGTIEAMPLTTLRVTRPDDMDLPHRSIMLARLVILHRHMFNASDLRANTRAHADQETGAYFVLLRIELDDVLRPELIDDLGLS